MCSVTAITLPPTRRSRTVGLADILSPHEIVTSNTLLDRFEARGLNRNHARQVLARDSSARDFWRSEHLVLESGARMYCWGSFWGSVEFHQQVAAILREERRGLHRLLLATRNSVALRPTIEKLLAAPMSPRQSQRFPSVQEEAEALIDLGLVKWEAVGTSAERLSDFRVAGTPEGARAARLEWAQRAVALQITRILADQLRRSNVITWGSMPPLEADTGLIPFNNLPFDHVGFSRLAPLLRFSKLSKLPAPTPVAFDVHAKLCAAYSVEAFLDRLQRAGMNKTSRLPILGIIAAPRFEKDAWSLARNSGLMAIDLRAMFGDQALAAMAAIEQLLARIGEPAEEPGPANVDQLAASLEGMTGSPIVADLRSLGFEVLTGLVMADSGWQSIELNRRYRFDDPDNPEASRELDVFGTRQGGDELVAIECKAEHSAKALDPGYLKRFFCETVPAMVREKTVANRRPPTKVIAEIWTTGIVGLDAYRRLGELPLPNYVVPALHGGGEVKGFVPPSLPACERLLAAIAAPPSEAA